MTRVNIRQFLFSNYINIVKYLTLCTFYNKNRIV